MAPGDEDGRSAVTGHSGIYDPTHLAVMELRGKIDTLTQVIELRERAQNLELKQMRDLMNSWRDDHEQRLRLLEGRVPGSLEARLASLELRKYVEPKTIYLAAALLATFGSLVVAIINLAIR